MARIIKFRKRSLPRQAVPVVLLPAKTLVPVGVPFTLLPPKTLVPVVPGEPLTRR